MTLSKHVLQRIDKVPQWTCFSIICGKIWLVKVNWNTIVVKVIFSCLVCVSHVLVSLWVCWNCVDCSNRVCQCYRLTHYWRCVTGNEFLDICIEIVIPSSRLSIFVKNVLCIGWISVSIWVSRLWDRMKVNSLHTGAVQYVLVTWWVHENINLRRIWYRYLSCLRSGIF